MADRRKTSSRWSSIKKIIEQNYDAFTAANLNMRGAPQPVGQGPSTCMHSLVSRPTCACSSSFHQKKSGLCSQKSASNIQSHEQPHGSNSNKLSRHYQVCHTNSFDDDTNVRIEDIVPSPLCMNRPIDPIKCVCFYFEQPTGSGKSPSNCEGASQANSCICKPKEEPADPCATKKPKATMAASQEVTQTVKCNADKSMAAMKSRPLTPREWRKMQFRKLGRDHYCPGTIQESAEGRVNYNALALNLMKETFGSIAKDPGLYAPLSLLQLFYDRIKKERVEVSHFLGNKKGNCSNEIEAHFQQKIPNDTNRAIMNFIKIEKVWEAHEVIEQPDYDFNVTKLQVPLPSSLVAVAYIGNVTPK